MLPSRPIYTFVCYLLLTPLWWVELILGWKTDYMQFFLSILYVVARSSSSAVNTILPNKKSPGLSAFYQISWILITRNHIINIHAKVIHFRIVSPPPPFILSLHPLKTRHTHFRILHLLLTLTLRFSFLWITSILWSIKVLRPKNVLTAAHPLWRFLTSPLHQILHSDHNLFWYSEDFILQAEMHINTKQTSIAWNHISYTFICAYKQDQVLLNGLKYFNTFS